MTRLFHFPLDPFCRRIRLAFGEYGVGAELLEERPWEGRPAFLAMNPAGELPILVEDDRSILCGVGAVGEYLEETLGNGEGSLLGQAPLGRAEVRRLISWFDQKCYHETTGPLLFERVVRRFLTPENGGGSPNAAPVREAFKYLEDHLHYVDHLAETRNWLAGETLTAADLAAAGHLSIVEYLDGIDWTHTPFAKSWYQKLKSRPSFRPLLADYVRGIPPSKGYADLDF